MVKQLFVVVLKSQEEKITWDFVIFLFLDTFSIQKCLETGKRQNPLK